MAHCYRCKEELTESNKTIEHVILNACGGRLKSKKLLCKICNSTFGKSFDKELAKVTNDLVNLLQIKRQKGIPQPIKGKSSVSGEEFSIGFDGSITKTKPSVIQKIEGDNIKLSISARDPRELNTILNGIKRKHPNIDINEIKKHVQSKQHYLNEPIKIESKIGGNEVFKAITKTAINFLILNGGKSNQIEELLPYLNGEVELDIVWMHYPDKSPYLPDSGEVSHIMRLVGDSKEQILYAYIELFNIHNYIILLNSNYAGKDMKFDYAFDLLRSQKINSSANIEYSRSELMGLFENKNRDISENIKKRFERVLKIADSRQVSNQNKKLISKGITNSLGKLPEGQIITEEILQDTVNSIMKEMTPFIVHRNKIKNTKEE